MGRMVSLWRSRPGAGLAAAALVVGAVGAFRDPSATGQTLDAGAVPWSELDLSVHELVASTSIRVSLDTTPTDRASLQWIAADPSDPVTPRGGVTATLEISGNVAVFGTLTVPLGAVRLRQAGQVVP